MPGRAPDDVVPTDVIVLGRIVGLFGVKGWVKVYSYSRPREAILEHSIWRIRSAGGWNEYEVAEGRMQGGGVVARLEGIVDRTAAAALIGADIAIERSQLPALKPGEYYWADLEGLTVVNLGGVELGTVSYLFETGANDVMVLQGERERLIPYIASVIREVDLERGVIRVDWDKDF
jgi:16S rRNA processing protein RimM